MNPRRALVALVFAFATLPLIAQQAVTSATLTGVVRDAADAPLAGANVTLTNVDRQQTQTAATDARGRFRFALLPVGDYRVAVDAHGFAPSERKVRLAIGAALDVAFRLQPQATETIDVTTAAPLVERERTQVAAAIAPEEVHDLPLNGRNYLDLALLAPGVSRTNTGASQRFAETSAVPGTGISVSTQRNLANSFVVDGLSANDDAAELAGTFFSQEVIREFAVVRAGGMAELGRASAGVINIATKSGTSVLRGDAYAYVRDERFDAANALTGTKLPLDQQQYGATLGGPLVAGRTFFFTNVEQSRQRSGGVATIAPDSAAAIDQRLDAIGYRGVRVTAGAFAATLDTTNVFARVDHATGAHDQLTLRLNAYDVASENARSAGGLNDVSRGTALESRDRTLAATNLWTASDSVLSETRAQATRSRLAAPPNDRTGPAVTIAGVANFGTATSSPTRRDIDLYELAEAVTWMRGGHAWKAGVDLLENRVTIGFPGALGGAYTFTSLANFLAGRYASYQQAFGDATTRQRNRNLAAFVQDEWRTSDRVTINAGLRYDVQRLPSPIHTDRDNLSPRLGVAWDVRGDGRSVLRAALGTYYDPIPLRAVANALQRNGVTYRIVQLRPDAPGAPAFPNTLVDVPVNVLTNITTIDPHVRSSRSDQAALQYERQFGEATAASIGYEHLRGRGILMSRNLGRTEPAYRTNVQYQSIGDSWYDGVTLAVTRRPVTWGSFRLSYTFSKGLDTSGNFFFSQPQDAHDIRAERGRSDNDQRHRLSVSGTLARKGWLFSYIATYASALPFNIQLPNDRNGDTNFNDRPAGVGRNTGRGFDYRSLDLRLSRTFGAFEAIVDAFNVLNRANYQVPNNIVTSPTFGKPTAVSYPGLLQLGVRVKF